MFMDADDMYEDYACEFMYNFAEEKKADYVSANYIIIDEFDKKREKPAFDTELYGEFKLKLSDPSKSFFVMNATSWNKIYNLEFLKKNKIQFDLNPPSEDDYFTLLCYMKAKRGYYTNKVIYNYRYNPNSTSNKCDKEYFQKQNYVYKVIYNIFKEKRKLRLYNRYYYAKKSAYLLGKIIDSDLVTVEEKRNMIEDLKWLFSLADDVDNFIYNESLKPIFKNIKNDEYEDAIKQMEYVRQVRNLYSDYEKSRMFFPTRENLQTMPKYDYDFIKKELEIMGDNENVEVNI